MHLPNVKFKSKLSVFAPLFYGGERDAIRSMRTIVMVVKSLNVATSNRRQSILGAWLTYWQWRGLVQALLLLLYEQNKSLKGCVAVVVINWWSLEETICTYTCRYISIDLPYIQKAVDAMYDINLPVLCDNVKEYCLYCTSMSSYGGWHVI